MGLFKKFKEMAGSVPKDLLENGTLARGVIVEVRQTNVSTGPDHFQAPVMEMVVEVTLDNEAPYNAKVRQAIPITVVPQLVPGRTIVAVRVDPKDRNTVAIDFASEPPVVQAKGSGGMSAAEVIANGEPCRAVIVESAPLGMKSQAGYDMYAFLLTVMKDGRAPYQVKVGNPVTPEGVPLVFPGSNLPAKIEPGDDESVVIDWDAALAEFQSK